MVQTKNFVVKTNGKIIEEFQQIISGLILQEHCPEVKVHFISSESIKEEFKEYFSAEISFINIQNIVNTKYIYNEKYQDLLLEKYEYGTDGYDFIVYEGRKEFKKLAIDILEYIRLKSRVHKKLFDSIHEYIFPQLSMVFDEENKINVGLHYSMDNMSKVYEKCENDDVFHYVDFTNESAIKKSNIHYFHIESPILLYIALSMCDFIIGDIGNKVNYESSMKNKMMIHDVSKFTVSDHIIPNNKLYDQNCMFPNSQLLLKYI